MRTHIALMSTLGSLLLAGLPAAGQTGTAQPAARPWGRVSFFTSSFRSHDEGGTSNGFSELTTALTYHAPDTDANGLDYGLDVRFSAFTARHRPDRASIYEGFVGARLRDGRAAFRVGHVSVVELGSLGSLAGGVVEVRTARESSQRGRLRAGAFGGLEPAILDAGYAKDVKKFGTYLAYDGQGARRHAVGYVLLRHGSLTERAVLAFTNFVPAGRKIFIYQAAELDTRAPAGRATRGLAYFFGTARFVPLERLELQATYNRGRSLDARTLSDDVLQGRPITPSALAGLLYESIGGRATVEVLRNTRLYAAFARESNNRDTESSRRATIGGHAPDVGGLGIDLTASQSFISRSQGSYSARYVSLGRQIGRSVYVSGDWSTSLSIVRFSRSDGLVIESRPHTTRYSGTATISLPNALSFLALAEYTHGDNYRDVRLMSGLTYRIR
jgi:hypothetical protein